MQATKETEMQNLQAPELRRVAAPEPVGVLDSPHAAGIVSVRDGKPGGPFDAKPAGAVKAKLYGLRAVPPSMSAELMLRHKGIRYRRVNVMPMRQTKTLRAKGFPGATAPALILDGRNVQTNRAIARALDEIVPEPPLFPADPEARQAVEEAERLCDELFQPTSGG